MKRTMLVSELIDALEAFDCDTPVVFGGLNRVEALYACQNAEGANAVCVIMSAGTVTDDDAAAMGAMDEGDYAEAVGA